MDHKTDADMIRQAQELFLKTGNSAALSPLYLAARRMAAALIARQCATKGFTLDERQIAEKSHDAAVYLLRQYMERPGFAVKKPAAYLYTCVLRELYSF